MIENCITFITDNGNKIRFPYPPINWLCFWMGNNTLLGHDTFNEPVILSIEKIQKLHNACKTVTENPQSADEILPTCGLLIYGKTEYNQEYYDSVKEIKQLTENILAIQDIILIVIYEGVLC